MGLLSVLDLAQSSRPLLSRSATQHIGVLDRCSRDRTSQSFSLRGSRFCIIFPSFSFHPEPARALPPCACGSPAPMCRGARPTEARRTIIAASSRELSVKVHAGQCRVASLGFRAGGPIGFGLRRELVDEMQRPKGSLSKGERKALQTDRVRIRPGADEEAAVIRWIYHQFVVERQSHSQIARQLNHGRIPSQNGSPWSDNNIHTILRNENYVGNLVYNRTSRRLGQKQVKNLPDQWVRRAAVIDPIVDANVFARAQKIMAERRLEVSDDEMLRRLRLLLRRKGKLSSSIIKGALGVSCVSSFTNHFGSLRKAFALIGYDAKRDCDGSITGPHGRLLWRDTQRMSRTQ